jgi:RNA polymerase sigma factor (TIGR02999 family)
MAGSLEPKEVSEILSAWGHGDQDAGNKLIGIVYQELRRLAAYYLQSERGDHTLQPTALVHELYLKLFSAEPVQLQDRQHFLAIAARQLRYIVVDYARSKHAQKRGGHQAAISLDEVQGLEVPTDSRVIDLDRALGQLEALDARAAQVVELRFFGGLTDEEAGKALGISPATVKRDWNFARSWLLNQMK